MPLLLTVACFSKIQIGFPFWYWLTPVVLDIGPLNGCVFCETIVLLTEREQNRNQATADITRPSTSSSNTDQSRIVSLPANTSLVVNTGTSFTPHPQTYLDPAATGSANVSTGTQTCGAEGASTGSVADEPSTSTHECCDNVAHEHRGKKRCTHFTV